VFIQTVVPNAEKTEIENQTNRKNTAVPCGIALDRQPQKPQADRPPVQAPSRPPEKSAALGHRGGPHRRAPAAHARHAAAGSGDDQSDYNHPADRQ